MEQKIKRSFKNSVIKFLGRITSQRLNEFIFEHSLKLMNFGNGGDFSQSGELFVLKYIQNKLKHEPAITIFDVGANVGGYSKALSEVFKGQAKIYSFEPSKKTFELLLETTKNCSNVFPNNFGLSDKENTKTLFTNAEGSGIASVYQRRLDHFGINMDKIEDIKLSTIDIFCKENKIGHLHFLKMDIEGHELSALNGAKDMIAGKKIDFIQFEFGGCNIDSRTYFQDFFYLLKDNYTIYRILEKGIYEIKTYREIHEIFITVNYLAVKK